MNPTSGLVTARLRAMDMKHISGPDARGGLQQGVVLDLELQPEDGSPVRSERIALSVSQLVAIANLAEVGLKELVTMGLLEHGTGWTPQREPLTGGGPAQAPVSTERSIGAGGRAGLPRP